MTTPLYSPQGQEQYLDIRFVFKVKHSPGNKYHLSVLLKEYLRGYSNAEAKVEEFKNVYFESLNNETVDIVD